MMPGNHSGNPFPDSEQVSPPTTLQDKDPFALRQPFAEVARLLGGEKDFAR